MPYIITTTTRANIYGAAGLVEANVPHEVSRTAVATLDEARDHVHSLGATYGQMAHRLRPRGTSRLPVGPLPDGTVIEVRQVGYVEIAAPVDSSPHRTASEQSISPPSTRPSLNIIRPPDALSTGGPLPRGERTKSP
jgi:hypothetical protein